MAVDQYKRMWVYFSIIVGVLIAILYPFDLVVAPARELRVIDSKGNPLGSAMVRQIWYQFPHDKREIEIGANPKWHNPKGQVRLPERVVRTNIASLVSGAVIQLYDHGRSASFRSGEKVIILVPGYQPKVFYDGRGLESGIVVFQ